MSGLCRRPSIAIKLYGEGSIPRMQSVHFTRNFSANVSSVHRIRIIFRIDGSAKRLPRCYFDVFDGFCKRKLWAIVSRNHGRRCIVIVIGIATHVHPTISRFRYRKGERRGQTRDKASSLRRVNLSITGGESTTMDKVVVGPVQGAFTDVDKWSDWS